MASPQTLRFRWHYCHYILFLLLVDGVFSCHGSWDYVSLPCQFQVVFKPSQTPEATLPPPTVQTFRGNKRVRPFVCHPSRLRTPLSRGSCSTLRRPASLMKELVQGFVCYGSLQTKSLFVPRRGSWNLNRSANG